MMFAWLLAGFIVGLIARRTVPLPDATPDLINAYIVRVALPAVILLRVPALTLDQSALLPVGTAWLVVLICSSVVVLLSILNQWPRDVTGALLMVAPLSNSAYVGIPVIDTLTEGTGTPYAIMYDQFGMFMAVSIYGSLVVALYGSRGRVTAGSVLRRIVLFPPFGVMLLALALPADALPDALTLPLTVLGWTMGPLAMFIVGSQLDLSLAPTLRRPVAAGVGLKLMIAPIAALGLARTIGGDVQAIQATTLQAAMPSQITAALMAMTAGFSRRLTMAVVGYGSIAALLTLPLFALLSGALG